jgi:hypothetical protein
VVYCYCVDWGWVLCFLGLGSRCLNCMYVVTSLSNAMDRECTIAVPGRICMREAWLLTPITLIFLESTSKLHVTKHTQFIPS